MYCETHFNTGQQLGSDVTAHICPRIAGMIAAANSCAVRLSRKSRNYTLSIGNCAPTLSLPAGLLYIVNSGHQRRLCPRHCSCQMCVWAVALIGCA